VFLLLKKTDRRPTALGSWLQKKKSPSLEEKETVRMRSDTKVLLLSNEEGKGSSRKTKKIVPDPIHAHRRDFRLGK